MEIYINGKKKLVMKNTKNTYIMISNNNVFTFEKYILNRQFVNQKKMKVKENINEKIYIYVIINNLTNMKYGVLNDFIWNYNMNLIY